MILSYAVMILHQWGSRWPSNLFWPVLTLKLVILEEFAKIQSFL